MVLNVHKILPERLKSCREKKGRTQKEIAKLMRISDMTLSQYESGKRKPSPQAISDFADVYNVTSDYLLGKVDHTKKTEDDLKKALENISQLSGNCDVVELRKNVRELLKIKKLTVNGKLVPEDKAKIITSQWKKWNEQLDAFVKILDLFD